MAAVLNDGHCMKENVFKLLKTIHIYCHMLKAVLPNALKAFLTDNVIFLMHFNAMTNRERNHYPKYIFIECTLRVGK